MPAASFDPCCGNCRWYRGPQADFELDAKAAAAGHVRRGPCILMPTPVMKQAIDLCAQHPYFQQADAVAVTRRTA